MKDKQDFLWGMYQEHAAQGRHHEVQRANVTNFIIVVSGALIAFIANKGVTHNQWILASFLIILGLFGAFFSAKQYERFRFHIIAAGIYRNRLEQTLGDTTVSEIRDIAKSDHQNNFFKPLVNLKLYYFWIALHVLIALLGLTLLIIILST